ncbi:MAG: NAD(P)-dependent oxidoreductase [Alphaproteobacteria bacterium]|nr:NAD(P)-dependent oxidoreductase [Alphaproteobacteria bacterium]
MQLAGKTIFITGGTRGIGKAIALRCAADGANVVVAAKTVVSTPKTPGTIHDAAREIDAAGGHGLGIQVDVRDQASIEAAVAETVERFGGIDAIVNNAGAIQLLPTEHLEPRRYDLMLQINVRATWMLAKAALPHLKKSANAHVVTLSPPIDLDYARWFAGHTAYTVSKFAMTMTALGLAEELRRAGIASNTLWPRTTIATAAVGMLGGDALMKVSRTPEIMADAAYAILTSDAREVTGNSFLDEDLLRTRGVTDFGRYSVVEGSKLQTDLFVREP